MMNYHYNYEPLDEFLTEVTDPSEVGQLLDDHLARIAEQGPDPEKEWRDVAESYYFTRKLRDIFNQMKAA